MTHSRAFRELLLNTLLFQKILPPLLKTIRSPPDNLEEYKCDYGFLGIALHSAVQKARSAPQIPASSSGTTCSTVTSAGSPGSVIATASRSISQLTG